MTIEQCYSAIESNYEEVLGRFAGNKMLVEKFARKFLDDPSYQTLVDTMDKADYEEAFRAAHTLKGVCANLGFTQLFKVSSDLTKNSEAVLRMRQSCRNFLKKCLLSIKRRLMLLIV